MKKDKTFIWNKKTRAFCAYASLKNLILAFFCIGFLITCSGPKNYILMMDTSGSMSKEKGALKQIKSDVVDFVKTLDAGDTLSLMTFSSTVKYYKTYAITKDSQELVKQVLALRASGAFTDVNAMLVALEKVGTKLRGNGRPLYMIIVSDGLDDPPPAANRHDLVDLKLFDQANDADGSWLGRRSRPYVYYLNIGALELYDHQENKNTDKAVEKKLNRLSDQVVVLEHSKQRGLAGVAAHISFTDFTWLLLCISLALFLATLLVVGFYKLYTRHKLSGSLTYCDSHLGDFILGQNFNLSKLARHSFKLGSKLGVNLKIRDLGLSSALTLQVKMHRKVSCLKPASRERALYTCDSQFYKDFGLIAPGDQFVVGNYMFQYKSDTKK